MRYCFIVENAFGRLAAMWRIFQRAINVPPNRIDSIVLAACVLQNFIIDNGEMRLTIDSDAFLENGSWRPEVRGKYGPQPLQRHRASRQGQEAKAMQEQLRDWFNTVGAVNWQDRMVAVGLGLIPA